MTQSPSKVSQSPSGLRNLKLNDSAKQTLSLAVATAGATLFNLILGLVTARVLGPSGRGVIAIAITIGATTSLVFSLGTNTAARYYLPRDDDQVTMGDYQAFIALMAVVSMVISLAIAWAITEGNPTYGGWTTVWLSGLVSALTFVAYMESDALNAFGVLRLSALLSAGACAVELALVVAFAAFHTLTAQSVLAVLAFGTVLQVVACLLVLSASHRWRTLRFSRQSLRLLLRKGVPALGMNAGQSFTFRLDRYIVAGVLGPAPLGVYSVAVAGSEVLRMIPAAWGQTAFYHVASGLRSIDSLRRERRFVLSLMVPALVAWGFVVPYLVHFTVGDAYSGAVTPWRILLIGEIGVMAYQIDSRLLASSGKTVPAGIAGAIGLVVVAILDVIWIPMWGLIGAAEASAIAYLAMGVAGAWALHKERSYAGPTESVVVDPDVTPANQPT